MKQTHPGTAPPLRYFAILPPLLAGCASHTEQLPVAPPALQTVDAFISTALDSLTQAQTELAQAAGIRFNPVTPATHSFSSPLPADSISVPSGMQHVQYTGSAPALPALVTHGGRNQTLPVAMRKIIPANWHPVLSQDLRTHFTEKVSWDGGDQWPRTLDKLAARYHLKMTVMWASSQVTVARDNATALSETKTHATVSNPPAGTSSPMPSSKHTTPAPATWRAETGQTLKDVLFRWGTTADCHGKHWSVQWATQINYRIDAPLSFSGTWHDALNGIFGLYQHAATPLYAGTATPQCILKVDDKPVR